MIRGMLDLVLLGFIAWTALVAFVAYKEYTVPEPSGDTQAIIVLGAQVREDGTLSLQLQWRMEEALRQYQKHPQMIVVCVIFVCHKNAKVLSKNRQGRRVKILSIIP